MGPLYCQGSIATGHTYGCAEGVRFFFSIPLAHVAPLLAQTLEHPNTILEANLDANAYPSRLLLTLHLTPPVTLTLMLTLALTLALALTLG